MTKMNKFTSIKVNMMIYSFSIIFLMAILSFYALSILGRYKDQMENMFEKHIYLSEIEQVIEEIDEELLGFLSTKSSTKLNDYMVNIQKLDEVVEATDIQIFGIEDVMMKNIVNLIESYKVQGNEAISYKRQRNVAKYYEHYEESIKIKKYILDYIGQLNTIQLNRNSRAYIDLVAQIRLLQNVTVMIVIVLIGLSLLIVYLITSRMVKPISYLSHAAEEIASGNLDTEDIIVETEDEWMLLAVAFNKMKNSISQYVEELKLKAETENKLKDEQLKNVKMEHLLDNAKLYALQSQINPHFLFNTINAGVQMSVMERATKTGQFLDTMSKLFRYNIRKMNSTCTLEEEIDNIRDYYKLLNVRFGKRIQFKFIIEETTLKQKVPPLILQPLVENAYIHGLSGLEEGGVITVRTYRSNYHIYVTIKDTGKGMSEETITKILSKKQQIEEEELGIGIRNVRDRLELYYHKKNIFKIKSQVGVGTEIIIELATME